ncbi:ATP-binding protein [Pseudodesulfovibrio sp. zrk46]|uniref:PAS domain-containing sensor histidine kinase n=1 Tax=Pseudodesulfovibrio sp. zrk46 TaxID=2725288 RepID=UPI00144A2505|nr:ATP-binding protein [Pseudodesulfovibrio sp. zrk46]QJB55918.1 hypothetical protein HFN16_05620 [Pseudodesulfovibrio sp. zrk46]
MKSSSLTDQTQENFRRRGTSFSKPFNLLLASFFIVQVVIGVFVIVYFIGGELRNMQVDGLRLQLEGRQHSLENYLEDRLALLEDYSKLPIFVAGVMHPYEQKANVVDFINALNLLKEDAYFALQDYAGDAIYSDAKVSIFMLKGNDLSSLIKLEKPYVIDIVMLSRGGPDCCYWRLSVPVRYNGLAEGVLTAFIPVSLDSLSLSDDDKARLSLFYNDELVVTRGTVEEPSLTQNTETRFPGIKLVESVSWQQVESQVQYLITGIIIALIIGSATLSLIIHLVGRKFLIMPHTKLQAVSMELEKEVERQTSDLKQKTAELFVENRERKDAQTAAYEAEQLITALLEGIGAAFFIVDPETGYIMDYNEGALSMFNVDADDLYSNACHVVFGDREGNMKEFLCPDSLDQETYVEGVAHDATGRSFPISRHLVGVEVRGKKHLGVILFDITERKNLERRLSIAQKLESIGELAAGVAHEINTPIQYIGDSVQFIEETYVDVAAVMAIKDQLVQRCRDAGMHGDLIGQIEELQEDVDLDFVMNELPKACSRALDGTDRVAKIVRAMKQFSHPGSEGKTPVDLNQSLENTITVAKNEWKYVAEVELDFDPLPLVPCLVGDMNQVFLNLIVNAAHAIENVVGNSGEKGQIKVSTRKGAKFVSIMISDTGCGIEPGNRDKIFDPFFTTKEVGKGTGQGLAIAHDIVVERHGGTIDVKSEVGKGSTFIVTLPYE